jgi:hypothetical protein
MQITRFSLLASRFSLLASRFSLLACSGSRPARLLAALLSPCAPAVALAQPEPNYAREQEIAQMGEVTPNVAADFDPVLGTPTFIRSTTAYLTRRSTRTPAQVVADFVNDNPATFGVSLGGGALTGAAQFPEAEFRIIRDFVTPALGPTGVRHLTYQQQHNGQDIYGSILTANVTGDGMLVNISSRFVAAPAGAAAITPPTCGARNAVAAACDAVDDDRIADITNLIDPNDDCTTDWTVGQVYQGVGETALYVQCVLHPVSATELAQAWVVRLPSNPNHEDAAWECIIKHSDLTVINHYDRTMRYCQPDPVTFRVYRDDSPVPGTPGLETPQQPNSDSECAMRELLPGIDDCPCPLTCTSCPCPLNDTRELVTITAADVQDWSPDGWINDNHYPHCARGGVQPADVPVSVLCGNNAIVVATQAPTDPVITGSATRTFDFANSDSLSAVATQAFYLVNEWHDRMHRLGFDEPAGNCQADNFGRGGLGIDPLIVTINESSINMGNVAVLDGQYQDSSRMTARLFTWGGRYAAVDATVALHEYGHVLSTRLHVGTVFEGAGGLGGGLFEGWSDYLALALTHQSGDAVDRSYPVFSWAGRPHSGTALHHYYFGGGRWYPYTANMVPWPIGGIASNPLTYGHADQGDPASPPQPPLPLPSSSQHWLNHLVGANAPRLAHRTGEIWASMLVQCRAALAEDTGYDAANEVMLQLVIDGMKLDPGAPSFIQARDAILQADLLRHGGEHQYRLWQGFSARKLGWYATEPLERGRARHLVENDSMPPVDALSIFFPDGIPHVIQTCEPTFVDAFVVSPMSPIEQVLAEASPNGQALGLPQVLDPISPGRYRAELLAAPCRQAWDFRIKVVNAAGQSLRRGAMVFAGVETVIFTDAMEGHDDDRGPNMVWEPFPWPAAPPSPVVPGQVERLDPNGGSVQPSKDATPGAGLMCWVTEDRRNFGTNTAVDDVDLPEPGARLTSPQLLAIQPDTTMLVEYSVWYVSAGGQSTDLEGELEFLRGTAVVKSEPPEEFYPPMSAHRWQRRRAVFNTGDTDSTVCKLRFRFIDPPPDSSVEFGIDDVRLSLISDCMACCDGDMNADGNIDQDDVSYLIEVVAGGPNPSGVDPDFNHDGYVDQDDVTDLIAYVGGAPCP